MKERKMSGGYFDVNSHHFSNMTEGDCCCCFDSEI